MKTNLSRTLFATVALLVASQPLLAATKKADKELGALVAALQTVSPDPLGGRLGLAVAATSTPTPALSAKSNGLTAQNSGVSADQRAYQLWKNDRKS